MLSVIETAKKFNGTVEDHSSSRHTEYHVISPDGKKWACVSMHCLLMFWPKGKQAAYPKDQEQEIRKMLERISHGLEDCDDLNCQWCSRK